MATKVYTTYVPGFAQSITVKNGNVTKVTSWTPNVPDSTERFIPTSGKVIVEMPNGRTLKSRKR